jgi:tetratricopeptide (TPR) repeat protein
MGERKRRKMTILFTVTFFAFVLLLFLPSTGWIVRQQLRMFFTTAPEKALMLLLGIKAKYIGLSESKAQKLEEWVKQGLKDAAERNPNDLPVQISSVLLTTPHTEVPKRLQELLKRFPKEPTLLATILRHHCSRSLRQMSAKEVATFERIAREGERVDPQNAYFPMMRAAVLFAAGKEEEALKALVQASKKSRWDNYAVAEAVGNLRLFETAFGRMNGVTKAVLAEIILEPDLAYLRSAARSAVERAIKLEREGKFDEGLKIRLTLIRCGKLIRETKGSSYAPLVGIAIAYIAAGRPRGKPHPQLPPQTDIAKASAVVRERFVSYLKEIGRWKEASWVEAELKAGAEMRSRIHEQLQRFNLQNFQDAALAVALNWALNLTILGAAILLAILGAVATLIERTWLKQYRWAAGLLILCWLVTMFAFWFNKPFALVFDLYAILFDLLGPLESKAIELAYEMSAVWRLLSRVIGIGLIAFVTLMTMIAAAIVAVRSGESFWTKTKEIAFVTACFLLLTYASILPITAQCESQIIRLLPSGF